MNPQIPPIKKAKDDFKNKKAILYWLILGVVVLVVGISSRYYFHYQKTQKDESKNNLILEYCKKYPYPPDYCLIEAAKDTKDTSFCEKIRYSAEGVSKERCFIEVAISTQNESICKKLPQPEGYSSVSKSSCLTEVAEAKKDLSLCSEIEEEVYISECFMEVAPKVDDSSTCDKIPDFYENTKKECYSAVVSLTGNFSDCERLTNKEIREYCYLEIINLHGKDITICDKITLPKYKNTCFRYVKQNIGLE